MPEKEEFELPEAKGIIETIANELGIDAKKKPSLFEGLPEEQLFPEEAPTFVGRYIAGACLEQIYNIILRHTPPGAPVLLSKGDLRWFYENFRENVREAWNLPEPVPDFTLTHLLGATKRQITQLSELKHYHESAAFDLALRTYGTIAYVIGRAISNDNTNSLLHGEHNEE
jgi:hypothetical protein